MSVITLRVIVTAAALCAATGASAEAMYKWVDDKGTTHFSSEPPPEGKGQKIEVKPVPPSSSKPVQRPEDWAPRASELREERLKKERKEEDARQAVERGKARCLRAQSDLDRLRSARRVYSTNERGERVYMDDQARATETEKAERLARSACGT